MDFTDLLNRGHKRYVEKHVRQRKFGPCEMCEHYDLLIPYKDEENEEFVFRLCNRCYDRIIFQR